ncbi:MAG: beta-galactosidase [Armatimonadota bacterium]
MLIRNLIMTTAALSVAIGSAALAAPLTVRVKVDKGAPRILVNNKPVRARVFYGQPSAGRIALPANGEMVSYVFSPNQTVSQAATMHLRFGQSAGEIVLDDMRIEDLTTGKDALPIQKFESGDADFTSHWGIWPQAAQNTTGTVKVLPSIGRNGSGGLQVKIVNPTDGTWPDFHIYRNPNLTLVQGHKYRVSFWAKATPKRHLTTAFYKPGNFYVYLGGPPGYFESQVKLAAKAGVDFVSTSIPLIWPEPGQKEDWRTVDTVIEAAIGANPKVMIIPRIPIYPPDWWNKAHPSELMKWESGTHPQLASPASTLYVKEASVRLARLVNHLESKYPSRIAGYHPNGQNTGEWFYMDSWNRPLNGYAPCDAIAFRGWLKRRYVTVDALRASWKNHSVDFSNAAVPSASRRHDAPAGIFRDPSTEHDIIDFVEFQQHSMANVVCDFAKVVRQASRGRKLVLMFYGYIHEFGAISTGAGSSGHYALRRVLSCPDIDIVCSPISYFDRGRGQSAPCMTAGESVALANKMWLVEDDTRTDITTDDLFPGAEHVLTSLEQTNNLLLRNVAQQSMRNFATWWMDLGATGWFDHPGYWAQMKRLAKLDDPMLKNPTAFRPEVALVVDENTIPWLADGSNAVTLPLLYESRGVLGRMGAPYGQYLLDDVIKGRVHAKLYIFANAWRLDAAKRAALLKATKGSVVIWCYAPGYFDGSTRSLNAMRQLTGMNLQLASGVTGMAKPTAAGKQLGQAFGVTQPVRPLFKVADPKIAEILAAYSDGSAAVVQRAHNGGLSLFVGVPRLTPELLRTAAKKAGVHLFTQKDYVVYANGPFLAVHSTKAGTVQIDTGSSSVVTDVLTGKRMGKGPKLSLPMGFSETRIMQIRAR